MRLAEATLARDLCRDDTFTIVDGPLRFGPERRGLAFGYIERVHELYPKPHAKTTQADNDSVASLEARVLPLARRSKELYAASGAPDTDDLPPVETTMRELQAPEPTRRTMWASIQAIAYN